MHPLDSSVLKLCRAQRHLTVASRLEAQYLGARPFSIETRIRNRGHRCTFVFHLHRNVPQELGVAIGDVVHNLRSALDHLAWQFALLTKSATKTTRFPLETSERDYDRAGGLAQRALNSITHPEARAIVRMFQPFHRHPQWPGASPLAVLEKLSNIDKHRTVNLTFVATRSMGVDVAPEWQQQLNLGECADGRAVADFTTPLAVTSAPPRIEFQPILLFDKAVAPSRVIRAIDVLTMCGKTVALAVRSADAKGLFPRWPGIELMDGTHIPPLPAPPPHWS